MTTLRQYGCMAEKHWREHRPKMVRELERKGQLQAMLRGGRGKDEGRNGHARHGIDESWEKRLNRRRRRRGKWCGEKYIPAPARARSRARTDPSPHHFPRLRLPAPVRCFSHFHQFRAQRGHFVLRLFLRLQQHLVQLPLPFQFAHHFRTVFAPVFSAIRPYCVSVVIGRPSR